MSNIVILYGSKYRSTSRIAGKMQSYLEAKNVVVDTMTAIPEPIDLTHYSLVIIGSGIYEGAPHQNVRDFIKINRGVLKGKKVAVFAVCGLINSKRGDLKTSPHVYADVVACGLSPVSKAVFSGRVPDLGWFRNWTKLRSAVGVKPGDYRDWDAIKRWTESLAEFA